MNLFTVAEFRGPVAQRQEDANKSRPLVYVEAHLNASVSQSAHYACAITANAYSDGFAGDLVKRTATRLGVPGGGVHRGAKGHGLIARVRWPTIAVVYEPAFVSHAPTAEALTRGDAINIIGGALAETIIERWPKGGLVAFSVGHAYRGTGDKGAPVHADHDENPALDQEAEIAEAYLAVATQILTDYAP